MPQQRLKACNNMHPARAFQTPLSKAQRRSAAEEMLQRQGVLKSPCSRLVTPTKPRRQTTTTTSTKTPGRRGTGNECRTRRTKTLYLIRHGQSMGQAANRRTRETDASLTDCGLTTKGMSQAQSFVREQLSDTAYNSIELVVSSPLTRALMTACLAFPATTTNILCHFHLRELGSMIPENIPRPTHRVLRDLKSAGIPYIERIDVKTLQPENWPDNHDIAPKVLRRDRVKDCLYWLARERPENTIAVVCHYHVIRAALGDFTLQPANAEVIPCELDMETGDIARIEESQDMDTSSN